MIKILPLDNLDNEAKEKCGEIFCHSSTDFTIYCTFCNMKAFSYEDFLLHIQKAHFVNNLLQTDEYDEITVKNEAIEDIADQLSEQEVLSNNLEHSDEASQIDENEEKEFISLSQKSTQCKMYKTPKCNSESDNDDFGLDEDYKSLQNEEKPYKCEQCDKAYKNLGILKIHITRAHEERSLDKVVNIKKDNCCPECDQIFSDKKDLDHHVVEMHEGYKCTKCEKRFKERRYLNRHEKYHTASRSYECHFEGCSKNFIVKGDLKRHIDTHTTERNFICYFENCGKAFQTERYLQRHEKLHTIPKISVCDVCGYTCKSNQILRIHLRRHTGEKPYACEVCDKRFISISARIDHMNSHSNKRLHVCKVCNASFRGRKSLYHHSFLHSNFKKFKCKFCDSAFKQAAGLAGHMRKHRDEDMITVSEKLPL